MSAALEPYEVKRIIAFSCVAWFLPLVAVVLLAGRAPNESDVLRPEPVAEFVTIGSRSDDGSQPAALTVAWTTPPALLNDASAGRVTEVFVSPGDSITTGDPIVSIDGFARIAYRSETPFYRELSQSDAGPDVEVLDAMLVDLGLSDESTLDDRNRYSRVTGDAVRSLMEFLGKPDASRDFDPADVIFVPVEINEVAQVSVSLGDTVQVGDVLLIGQTSVASASVELTGAPERRSILRDEAITATLPDNTEVGLTSLDLDENDFEQLSDRLAAPDDSQQTLDVTVALTAPQTFAAIPSAALVSTSAGGFCLFHGTADNLEVRRLDAEDLQFIDIGIAYANPDLEGLSVLANPTSMSETEVLCNS